MARRYVFHGLFRLDVGSHGVGEETKLLRSRWRSSKGCHCQFVPHTAQRGCQAEQVGALGLQEQTAWVLEVRIQLDVGG